MFVIHFSNFLVSIGNVYHTIVDNPRRHIALPSSFNIPSHTLVSVAVVPSIVDAIDLFVEPVTVEDWELLEFCNEWLENGGLLQQVCVVYSGQITPLRLQNNSDVVHVRILPKNFRRDSRNTSNRQRLGEAKVNVVWPSSVDGSLEMYSDINCLRLVADTQVIIAPKPRQLSLPATTMFDILPSREDFVDTKFLDILSALLSTRQNTYKPITISPCTIVIHPESCNKLMTDKDFYLRMCQKKESIVRIQLCSDDPACQKSSTSIVRLLTSINVPEGRAGMFKSISAIIFTCYKKFR
jgi:Peroxisome biogenesis factor 1, N-terminal